MPVSIFRRPAGWILFVIYLLSGWILFTCDGLKDNLTGLFWLEHRYFETGMLVTTGMGWMAWCSRELFLANHRPRQAHWTFWCALLLWLGFAIPYRPQAAPFWSSFHLLLCLAGFGGWAVCFIQAACDPLSPVPLKKTAMQILFWMAAALVLFAWSGQISLLCELIFWIPTLTCLSLSADTMK